MPFRSAFPVLFANALLASVAAARAPAQRPAAAEGSRTPLVAAAPAPRGHLLVVGGGGTTDAMLARAVELGGGRGVARVAVFPPASSQADSGARSAAMWREAGARDARVVSLDDLEAARTLVREASVVWFGGGDQKRLVEALAATDLPALVRERHAAGAVVGGTSAGAAAMSRAMITGDYARGLEAEEALSRIEPGIVLVADGLALDERVVFDQHFVARRRFQRLLAVVLERPDLVGVGVDERTAVLVHGGALEVLGEGAVVVVDARAASLAPREPEKPLAATGVALHVLRAGMRFELAPPAAGDAGVPAKKGG
jgi:cyanophycinase